MAIPTIVAIGAHDSGSGGNSSTPMPAGIQEDDWIFLIMETEGEEASAEVLTDADFELVDSVWSQSTGASDSTKCTVWKHLYNGTDTPSTAFSDPGNHWMCRTVAVRGADATTPIAVKYTDTNATNTNSQSVGPVGDSATDDGLVMIVAAHGDNGNSTATIANSNLSGMTTNGEETSQGSDATLLLGYGTLATQGEIGTFTWTTSSEERAVIILVLQETAGGGTDYDETGRAVSITATVGLDTDQADLNELALAISISATVTVTDVHHGPPGTEYDETGRAVSITATVGLGVDQADLNELALAISISATVTVTDVMAGDESLTSVTWRTELALGTAGGLGSLWDTGLWDTTGVWDGEDPTWVATTHETLAATTNRGRDRLDTRMRTGRASVTLANEAGKFNPDHGATPPGDLTLRPGRWARVSANYGTGWVPVFSGYIDTFDEGYPDAGHDSNTLIRLIGFAGSLSAENPGAVAGTGAGDLTSERVDDVLDRYGWSAVAAKRNLQTGVHTMIATTHARTRLEEIQRAADAEGGVFFMDGAGVPTFRARDWLENDTRSTIVQMAPGSSTNGEPEIEKVKTEWTAQVIKNDIRFTRVGGSAVVRTDATSQGLYGVRSKKITDLEVENDTQVGALADRYLDARKYDRQRITQLVLVADNDDPPAQKKLIDTQLGDLIEVTVEVKSGNPWSYVVEAHVMGIAFNVTAEAWRAQLWVDDSALYVPT